MMFEARFKTENKGKKRERKELDCSSGEMGAESKDKWSQKKQNVKGVYKCVESEVGGEVE